MDERSLSYKRCNTAGTDPKPTLIQRQNFLLCCPPRTDPTPGVQEGCRSSKYFDWFDDNIPYEETPCPSLSMGSSVEIGCPRPLSELRNAHAVHQNAQTHIILFTSHEIISLLVVLYQSGF